MYKLIFVVMCYTLGFITGNLLVDPSANLTDLFIVAALESFIAAVIITSIAYLLFRKKEV